MKTKKESIIWTGPLVFLMLLILGSGSPVWRQPLPADLPAHVHPAVKAARQANPTGTLQVLVSRDAAATGTAAAAARLGARITAEWEFIHMFAAEVPARGLAALARLPGVRLVLADTGVGATGPAASFTMDQTKLQVAYGFAVEAESAWERGLFGQGVTVAVVDSGVTNPVIEFGNRILQSVSVRSDTKFTADKFGHGTHVAGIIAGDGSVGKGKYVGIAPRANIVNVKFSDDYGVATERDLVSALEWVYKNRTRFNIRVLNLSSTVSTATSYKESPTAAAVEQLWFSGVVVVVSAGNRGADPCAACYAPANDPYVISVGAAADAGTRELPDDKAVPWSSFGITKDGQLKPEVVAPGSQIISYMPSGSLRSMYPGNIVEQYYFRMGGTSMAAPVVSGVAALLLEARPNLTPDEVKWLLMQTARPYVGQPPATGGMVSARAALAYTGPIGRANQGLTPSPMLDGSTGIINYSSAYWANAYWANAYWSNSFEY